MGPDDETQQPVGEGSFGARSQVGWMRRLARATRRRQPVVESSDRFNVHAAVRALPTLLDGASLPNGVVELVIEDLEAPTRALFDIHDGRVTLVEPGQCVPWASISGSPTAWTIALGPKRRIDDLRLTGDTRLAQRVLAALPCPA